MIKNNVKTSLTTSRYDLDKQCPGGILKKVLLKIAQNSQEKSWVRISFSYNFN